MSKSISKFAGTKSVLDLDKLIHSYGGYTVTTSTGCETTKNSPGGQADCKDGEGRDNDKDTCKGIEFVDNPFDLEFDSDVFTATPLNLDILTNENLAV